MDAIAPRVVRIEIAGGTNPTDSLSQSTVVVTGLVIDDAGLVITSLFGLETNPAAIVVVTPDGARRAAELVARDRVRLLALVRAAPFAGLTPLRIASEPRVGETVIAVGRVHSLGAASLHTGVVSAVGRLSGRAVQTDADTSPANYGGPLVNTRGELHGVIAPLAPEGQPAVEWYDSGIGFAVPWPEIATRLDALEGGNDIEPGVAGLGFPGHDPLRAAAEVIEVAPTSAAAAAGLAVGDRVVGVAGAPVATVHDARRRLGGRDAGSTVVLRIERAGAPRDVTLTLAARPTSVERAADADQPDQRTKKPGGR
ncbi:MAG: S1C family serine protease [Lacipirellulaceae bacterium]